MKDSGIDSGDYALVEVTEHADENDRVVAIIGDVAVIKRIHYAKNAIVLNPEAEGLGYSPIVMKEDFQTFGRVIDVIQMSGAPEPLIEFVPIEDDQLNNYNNNNYAKLSRNEE